MIRYKKIKIYAHMHLFLTSVIGVSNNPLSPTHPSNLDLLEGFQMVSTRWEVEC